MNLKRIHFKFYKFILSRPYPFDHWLILITSYFTLWIYFLLGSIILTFILDTPIILNLKFYFVLSFFAMLYLVFTSYKLSELFKLFFQTITQIFRITIGKAFGLKPINYTYRTSDQKKYLGRNILDFDKEKFKVFEKKYAEIDFLVLNNYITIDEGNRKTDDLLKKEYGYGFLTTLNGHYFER